MPRAIFTHNPNTPYHISARCINKEWFIGKSHVWDIMSDYLYFLKIGFNAEVHSFVLMSNHFHLIAKFPENNISKAMLYFMRETSKQITKKAGRINQTYGSRYFKSSITNPHHYMHVYKYVYRNPVEGKLSQTVEAYKYSTLHGLLGFNSLNFPTTEDTLLFENINDTLMWLNTAPKSENRIIIQKSLKRTVFKLPKSRKTRKLHELELDAY